MFQTMLGAGNIKCTGHKAWLFKSAPSDRCILIHCRYQHYLLCTQQNPTGAAPVKELFLGVPRVDILTFHLIACFIVCKDLEEKNHISSSILIPKAQIDCSPEQILDQWVVIEVGLAATAANVHCLIDEEEPTP